MERYKNLSGDSPVAFFSVIENGIVVRFKDADGTVWDYTYDARSPGLGHVSRMEHLAKLGKGLATYINQNVRRRFVKKQKVSAL